MPCTFHTLLLAVALGAAAPEPIVIHVAPAGQAIPPEEAVVATLSEAFAILRERRTDGDTTRARIVVHDGRHELGAPLEIDAALAGEGLTLEAAPGATPLVSGGRAIPGLRAAADGTWRTTIDAVRDGEWWFEELFVDLAPRTRARHPNAGFARVVAAGADNRTSFTFDPAALPPALLDDRAEVVFLHDWSISRVRIAAVDADANSLTTADPIGCKAAHYRITNFEPHPRFFVEGSPALVDQPGEWALDRATGEFVYRPQPGEVMDAVRLVAPSAPALLRVAGSREAPVANVVVLGLAFAHVSWPIPARGYAEGQAAFHEQRDDPADNGIRQFVPAAIAARWASGLLVERCRVTAVGGTGISLGEGCRACRVLDTVVMGAGANGIMVGAGSADAETVAVDNEVSHCSIRDCGRRFFGAVGVWIGLTRGTTVAHCEIHDLPYTGVSVGWRWDDKPTQCRENVIAHNHIHDVMQMLSDGGGIYTLGWQPGTVLRGNAIHDVRANAGRAPSNGVFLDQGTKDLVLEGNVIWNVDTTPLRWHMTHANTVRGNTLVLRAGQQIAHYNRAKAEDVAYADNRTPDASSWSADEAQGIAAAAGARRN